MAGQLRVQGASRQIQVCGRLATTRASCSDDRCQSATEWRSKENIRPTNTLGSQTTHRQVSTLLPSSTGSRIREYLPSYHLSIWVRAEVYSVLAQKVLSRYKLSLTHVHTLEDTKVVATIKAPSVYESWGQV